jgi:hypothetical protein
MTPVGGLLYHSGPKERRPYIARFTSRPDNEDNGATRDIVTPQMRIRGVEVSYSCSSAQCIEDLQCEALFPGNKLRVPIG